MLNLVYSHNNLEKKKKKKNKNPTKNKTPKREKQGKKKISSKLFECIPPSWQHHDHYRPTPDLQNLTFIFRSLHFRPNSFLQHRRQVFKNFPQLAQQVPNEEQSPRIVPQQRKQTTIPPRTWSTHSCYLRFLDLCIQSFTRIQLTKNEIVSQKWRFRRNATHLVRYSGMPVSVEMSSNALILNLFIFTTLEI